MNKFAGPLLAIECGWLTLYVTPVVYLYLENFQRQRKRSALPVLLAAAER
jgi:hypothetical protein